MDSDLKLLKDDPSHTLRGFRHQALYILLKILDAGDDWNFQPEGIEDLAVYTPSGELEEIVQVKSYTSPLVPSSFGAAFYRRLSVYIRDNPTVPITIVSYGPIGPSLERAIDKSESEERSDFVRYIARIIRDENSANQISDRLYVKKVAEEEVVKRIIEKLSFLCTGVEPQRALEVLWWWIYSASENRALLDRKLIIGKITQIGRFLTQRAAFHAEWFKTIIPLEGIEVSDKHREFLAEEFASGVAARLEHIIAGVDVRRDVFIDRINDALRMSNVTVIHGASGQGKTALVYRYCHDFFPAAWRYRVDYIEDRSHARNIALAIVGHAEATAFNMLVFVDVQPGNTGWIDLAKYLVDHQTIKVLIAVREEDWRRGFGQLAELRYSDIELTLEEKEAQAIYDRMRSAHDVPHVLDFQDAWQSFGGSGPLLEFAYFLRHNDTLEDRLKGQIIQIQDTVRRGELQSQELDFLRLAAVATAYEAWVDLRKLAEAAKVYEPQRTVESFEKEYFLRLTPDGRYVVALHPIRSLILSRLLTDAALSPWTETARRVLGIIRERDLERFLLFAFLREPDSRTIVIETLNSFHPRTWKGLCGCMRALLWLGVRQYTDENKTVIRDAFSKCNEGWQIMLNFDVAGITDFKPWETFACLGKVSERVSNAVLEFADRQTETKHIFSHYDSFMQSRSCPVSKPAASKDWRSLGEVCFWLGHLRTDTPVRGWVTEDLLNEVLAEESAEAMGEACIGVFKIWGKRYQEWYQDHRQEIHRKLRTELRAVSLIEEEDTAFAIFVISRDETILLTKSYGSTGASKPSLNDLIVAKLRIIRNIIPFFERYGCKGIGHLTGLIDPPYDESEKGGVLKKYLLPHWGPALNNHFIQLGNLYFRLPTWAHFSDEVLRIRSEALDLLSQAQEGILAHFSKKETVDIIRDYIQPERWDSLKADCFRVHFLPQCAVDEFGLDVTTSEKISSFLPGQKKETDQKSAANYLESAREYARTLNNFLTQAPPVLVWNAVVGKAKRRRDRKRIGSQLREAGLSGEGQHLTMLNLIDLCKSLTGFQQQMDMIFSERIGFDEHTRLSEREINEIPNFCLLWREFLDHSNFSQDGAKRIMHSRRLKALDAKNTIAQLSNRLGKALHQAGEAGIDFHILDTDAHWDEKPTLWVVCDASDPCRILDASRVVEKCLRKALSICRTNDAHQFVVDFYWNQVVAIPLIAGKSLRKFAYPHLGNAVYTTQDTETSEWWHIALPVADVTWQGLGLAQWQLPRLQEFQDFSDTLSRLWEICGHFADFIRVEEDLDDLGMEIARIYIQEWQEALNTLLQGVLDQQGKLWENFDALRDKSIGRPMLIECFSVLSELENKLLPRKEWSGYEQVSLNEIKEWHDRLTEALGIVSLAEILWSADTLGLECDLERLARYLQTQYQLQD